ncbi:MAG TPA: DUF2884 family protein [Dyella sp.]|uniref:DUF2884 family protein n=1 Tax=Dyella sp. TaxID=1869338 RepID=UPI002B8ABC45|nr:DUF2884 family protein [Dyella sp.]HTV84603.1 DUF2884 family protein [Dyella sp.]
MHRHLTTIAFAAGLVMAGGAQASSVHGHAMQCSFNSDYDVQIKPDGIAFSRESGPAQTVFIHDGQLRIDGRPVTVSPQDGARLRSYERQVRDLLPAMAGIARDGVDIGYSAMTTVAATLTDDSDERTRIMDKLRDRHDEALQQIDVTLGHGFWKAGDSGETFGAAVEEAVADMVGSITRDVLNDALSNDPSKLASLQARTSALETTLDKAVEQPAEKLAQRADALCPSLGQLEQLQQQFQFRLPNGERLTLLSSDTDGNDKASHYAQR